MRTSINNGLNFWRVVAAERSTAYSDLQTYANRIQIMVSSWNQALNAMNTLNMNANDYARLKSLIGAEFSTLQRYALVCGDIDAFKPVQAQMKHLGVRMMNTLLQLTQFSEQGIQYRKDLIGEKDATQIVIGNEERSFADLLDKLHL